MSHQIQIPAALLNEIGRLVVEKHLAQASVEGAVAEIERLQKELDAARADANSKAE